MSSHTYCSIDLELAQPNTNPQVTDSHVDESKIIQMGWCIFTVTESGIDILRERSEFVNIGVPLSTFIKKLTGITDEQIAGGGTVDDAYRKLVSDVDEFNFSRSVLQWGAGDMECIREELVSEEWVFGQSGLNVKHLYQVYAQANHLPWRGGLKKTCNRLGLEWKKGKAHDALVDAINTAEVFSFIQKSMKG